MPALAERYRRSVLARLSRGVLVLALALAAMLADLLVGGGTLTLPEVLATLLHPAEVEPALRVVVWTIRLPVACLAALIGVQLALAGSLLQTVLDNPLAEPFTLGISSAAGFGAALAIVFQSSLAVPGLPPELVVAANAFLLSLGAVLLIGVLAGGGAMGAEMVTLLGIAVHFTFSALLAFAQYVADPNQLQALVFWLLGSLVRASWLKVGINAGVLLLALPVLAASAWGLSALRGFGDRAVVLGVRVRRLRLGMMVLAALLAGTATATVGLVGFVGLVAPHMARLLVGEDQRFALPVAAACGMALLTLASLASKLVIPGVVLPIGMVTSVLGVPFFLAQVLRMRRRAL